MEQQLVINHCDHKLCNSCNNLENLIIGFDYSTDSSEFTCILDLLTSNAKKNIKSNSKELKEEIEKEDPLLNIEILSNEECLECCGLIKENIAILAEESSCSIQIVFEFFCKCRHKLSDRFGGILFKKD